MANKRRRMRDKPPANVVPMVKKAGLIVPSIGDKVEVDCKHVEVAKRYTKEELGDVELECGDCSEAVIIHTMNFVVLTPDKLVELKENLAKLAVLAAQQERRKKLGLVVPGQDGEPPA